MGEKAHEIAKELKIENFTGSDKLSTCQLQEGNSTIVAAIT